MKKFKELTEAKGMVAFAFGRFNPPTTGHEKLIQKVASVAGGGEFRIYPSHTQGPKDPLPYPLKVAYMRKMFRSYARNIIADSNAKTAIDITTKLYDEGYTELVMVVGDDRLREFESLLKNYNGVKARHGYYNFDSIKVVSAGERDPDSEGVEGMSASKMRAAAEKSDFDSFKLGIPATLNDADKKKLYFDVRKNMGIREERDMGNDYDSLRDAYLTGKIWNVGEIVEARGIRGEVVRRGTNYLSFVTEDGKVHKAWLHEIELDEAKSPLEKLRDFDKSRVAAGKPPIFTDKNPPKFVRMKKAGMMTIMNVPTPEIDKWEKRGYKIVEEVDIDERNYAMEYANYQGTPEQIARRSSRNKARRTMGDNAVKGMDVGHIDNDPMNNSPKNLRMEKPSDNRREPRLREEKEVRMEDGWARIAKGALAKLSQNVNPDKWKKVVDYYTKMVQSDPKYIKNPNSAIWDIDRMTGGKIDAHELRKHINKLVDKGMLPIQLKAEVQVESFSDFVRKINEVKQDKDIKDREGTQPAKYYAADIAPSTKKKRAAHFTKKKAGPAPGDATAKTKPSQYTKKFKQMYSETLPKDAEAKDYIDDFENSDSPQFKGKSKKERKDMAIAAFLSRNEEAVINEEIKGLMNKSEKTGISYSILKQVYDRGLAAYKTGHRPGATAQQWAFARVNSFITKGKTWSTTDADLAKQVEMVEQTTICCEDCINEEETGLNEWGELTEVDDKSGKELNNPTKGDVKKYKVYVRNDKGNVVKVEFGDPNMEIKRDDPQNRASFRARHSCDDDPGPKWKARYWSCKFWSAKSVTDLMKG